MSTAAPPAAAPEASGPATATGEPVALDKLQLGLEPVARGFDAPVFVTHAGDGSDRLFVVEQTGRVQVVRDGQIVPGPFLDVSRLISTGGERGLLGLAFSPDYANSGELYLNYTDTNGDTNVARFIAQDPASDTPAFSGPTVVLKVAQPYSNHNGGCIVFEPGTQRLWVGMGDGGSGGDPKGNAQNQGSLLGKMLVLDFGKGPAPEARDRPVRRAQPVAVLVRSREPRPVDRRRRPEHVGGDRLRRARAGERRELGLEPVGGQPSVPGGREALAQADSRFPITEYNHGSGQSVTGGYVYRGSDFPALVGTYVYGDFSAGWIAGLRRTSPEGTPLAKAQVRTLLPDSGIAPSSFGEDAAGELYVCDYGGALFRVTAQPPSSQRRRRRAG